MGRIRAEQGPVDPPGWCRVGPWWVPGGGDMRQEGSGTPARVGPRAGGCCRSAGHRAE